MFSSGYKSDNADVAIKHIQYMENKYHDEIMEASNNTKTYSPGFNPKPKAGVKPNFWLGKVTTNSAIINLKAFNGSTNAIKILDKDCTYKSSDEVYSKHENFKVAALNFASYRHPGGGFIKGAMAQEESLCHDSDLYNILVKHIDFYDYNSDHLNDSLYTNRALYSPNVRFEISRLVEFCDIITCASPNLGAFVRKGNSDLSRNTEALKERIKFIYDILKDNDVTVPILGAFGCGVFKQYPEMVAKLFVEMASNYNFKTVVFAVPDEVKLEVFKEVILATT